MEQKLYDSMLSQRALLIYSSLILATLFIVTWYQFARESRIIINQTIIDDIFTLQGIFKTIADECRIVHLDHEKNHIDFLTVKQFVGSQVGSMNLMFPKKWKGPYLQENLTIQSKVYEIVATKNGYYIVPGTGVRLSNGKIMGKDIIINTQTDINTLINEEVGLEYKGKALVTPIQVEKPLQPIDTILVDE